MFQSPVTYHTLVQGLHQLGVLPGATVEVHSSLSAFGWVDGGAATVITALMDVLTPTGTIVMSAYPVSRPIPLTDADRSRGVTWKVRKLAPDSLEPTGMGRVADAFRQRHDVVCGDGFFRNCAWGRNAEAHGQGYNRLLANDGWCLLLGVGIDRCSSMHLAETTPLPAAISDYWAIPDHVQQAYDSREWNIGYGGTPEDAWQKVWASADQQGLIRHTQIGQANCHYFKVQSVIHMYQHWRETDPYGLYGAPRPVE